jgi:TNF receptor-associated factor 5
MVETGTSHGHHAPPNTPSSEYNRSPTNTRRDRKPVSLNLTHNVDLRAITYVDTVDENLICPICRCALVDPVTTDCDHTFCKSCIKESLSHHEVCPIDRSELSREATLNRSPKIVINQLDNLKAECPCCEAPFARSMLKNHLERYCMEAVMRCPGKNSGKHCEEVVERKHSDKGCLHFYTTCPDCQAIVWQIDVENHREILCKERHSECEHCAVEILRCKKSEHDGECPDVVVPCKWAEYGCQHEAKRKDLEIHTAECAFKLVGPMAEMLKKEISVLRTEIRTLTETNQLQERRIKFLERTPHNSDRLLDYSDLPSQPLPSQTLSTLPESANADQLDPANEYLLSLLEAQESKVSQLSADMTELDSKQTVMLFNETLPIKNELAEMRSNLQVTSMHVRWLMRFRIQENQRRFGGGPGVGPGPSGGGSDGGGSSSDSPLPRRLSDSMTREIITKL